MITDIKIKSCIPYDDVGAELNNCKEINFIYGTNGSGKTTISEYLRNYDCVEERYSACEIDWDLDGEQTIYVYNKPFRKLNFNQEEGIPGVFTLGEDSIADLQAIKNLKKELEDITGKYNTINSNISVKEDELEKLHSTFTESAWQEILKRYDDDFKEAFKGVRNNKNNFVSALKYRVKNPRGKLSDKENLLKRSSALFKNEATIVECFNTVADGDIEKIEKISSASIWHQVISGSEDVDISKLIKELDNSSWVHEGMKYLVKSGQVCPFCQQKTIDNNFRTQLESFFDKEYTEKIELMKSKQSELNNILIAIINKLNNNLDKNESCDIGKLNLEIYKTLIDTLKVKLEDVNNKINSKIMAPEKKISFANLGEVLKQIQKMLRSANEIIEQNNQLVREFDTEHKKLVDDIWYYCIHESDQLINRYRKDLDSIDKALKGMQKSKNNYEIKAKKIKQQLIEKNENMTSIQPAVDQINNSLKAYGFSNFHIEPYSEVPGRQENKYRIVRDDGSMASSTLSEGEATFITFLYFMQLTKGATDKEKVNEPKIIVLDDPISSLDSNILYLVSTMVKNLAKEIKSGNSDVKQLFIFTHNVYFHKEASFINGRTHKDNQVNYWIIRKNNGVAKIQGYGMENPISSTYELLWKELREDNNISLVSMQNIMRRIIENYFKIIGQKSNDYILSKFEKQEEKIICESLLSWINDGSHTIYDDLHIDPYSDMTDIFKSVFRDIFDKTGHIAHYNMMMGHEDEIEVK